MFGKILRKLTVLNSIVFLVIFVIFGGVILGYLSYRLFDEIDDSLRFRATAFRIANGRVVFSPRLRPVYDPRTFLLLRNTEGYIINPYPGRTEELDDAIEAAGMLSAGELRTIHYQGHVYRILDLVYQYEENILITDKGIISVGEVVAVSIVDSEVALLNNLLKIVLAGLVIGTTIIFLAGFYLAKRALVPIQAAWEKQQQFVADASHELRSPLCVIQSNAELILRHPDHSVEQEGRRVTNILREAMRMTKLVATLLTLARADANKSEIQLAAVVFNDIVDTIREQFKPLAELKGIEFDVEIREKLEFVADRERLHQLLVILLDNALKYTAAPGRIALVCYEQSDNIHIRVEDTGSGITPEELPYIFDRFFRGDKSRSRESGGTGLGLSIAEWIVVKHGGKIKVDSEVGVGTRFHIVLPVKRN